MYTKTLFQRDVYNDNNKINHYTTLLRDIKSDKTLTPKFVDIESGSKCHDIR